MTYNEIMQKVGKQITKNVYYINNTRTDVNPDNIVRVKPYFKTSLVGTLMQGCELILKEPINGTIYVEIEARYGSNTASMTYGPYNLKEEPKYNASDKTYTHQLYDNMIKSMVDYKPITITYPTTIYNFFVQLITEIGYTTNIQALPNGNLEMASDIYDGINFTYRSVLDDIAQANGVLFYIDGNEIKIASLNNTNVATINDDILKNQNISFGEHFGPINTIVLSRSGDSDYIYKSYPENLPEADRIEFIISDNQLMNENNRSDFLPALLNQLKGIEYDIHDVELVGYGNLLPLQKITFTTGGKTYNSYAFNSEKVFTSGYKEVLYVERPEETNTDYTYADKTDQTINQAYIIVRKQQKEIQALASEVGENSEDIAQIQINTNSISEQITNVTNDLQGQITTQEQTITATANALTIEQSKTTNLESAVNDLQGTTENNSQQLNTISNYIRYENGILTLGESNSNFKLELEGGTNGEIRFMGNGTKLGYFSSERLYVENTTVFNNQVIAKKGDEDATNYYWHVTDDGCLDLDYGGTEE